MTQKDAGARQSDERRPKKCAVTSTPPAVSRASLNYALPFRIRRGFAIAAAQPGAHRHRAVVLFLV